jgi:ribosomal protein RSM22 (predicted rRNA methylase)
VQLPVPVREWIEERANGITFADLRDAARAISEAYREGHAPDLRTPESTAAYLATRMPATYAAAHAVLGEVRLRLPDARIASVLDIGAGSGAAALAARQCFGPSRITLIERSAAMRSAAREILPDVEIRSEDFTRIEAFPPHDLVIAAYALGEGPSAAVVSRLWQAARLALLILEPGSTRGFTFIRDIRSRLLAAGAHMLAPCPTEGPCPMADPDWCHFAARVERSSLHRRLKEAELSYEDEKFSYVAVTREPAGPAGARVLRRPRQQPGLILLETCTPRGLETVRVAKRDRERFRAARRAAWGSEWAQPV